MARKTESSLGSVTGEAFFDALWLAWTRLTCASQYCVSRSSHATTKFRETGACDGLFFDFVGWCLRLFSNARAIGSFAFTCLSPRLLEHATTSVTRRKSRINFCCLLCDLGRSRNYDHANLTSVSGKTLNWHKRSVASVRRLLFLVLRSLRPTVVIDTYDRLFIVFTFVGVACVARYPRPWASIDRVRAQTFIRRLNPCRCTQLRFRTGNRSKPRENCKFEWRIVDPSRLFLDPDTRALFYSIRRYLISSIVHRLCWTRIKGIATSRVSLWSEFRPLDCA